MESMARWWLSGMALLAGCHFVFPYAPREQAADLTPRDDAGLDRFWPSDGPSSDLIDASPNLDHPAMNEGGTLADHGPKPDVIPKADKGASKPDGLPKADKGSPKPDTGPPKNDAGSKKDWLLGPDDLGYPPGDAGCPPCALPQISCGCPCECFPKGTNCADILCKQ